MNRGAIRLVAAIAAVLALSAGLAACYVPDSFIAEIRINRAGAYAITYRGDLTWAPLHRDVHQGEMSEEEAAEKAEIYRRDLLRDEGFSRVEHKGNGRFEVAYERQGVLPASRQVTFVRRNADIMAMIARPDGTVTIRGRPLAASQAQQAVELGLGLRGRFHVVTDAAVLRHNAQEVRSYKGYDVYVWDVENPLSPMPRLVLVRDTPSG